MPLFEYVCRQCEEEFEELVRHPDDPVECPACGSSEADRKLPLVGYTSGGTVRTASSGGGGGCSSGNCSSCSGGCGGGCHH